MGKTKTGPSGIKWRTIVSLSTSWMFFIMAITGVVLYLVPQGRIAYWVDWHLLGLTKTDWGNIHIVTSFLFAIVGGFHLYFNWKPFLGHLRRKLAEGIRMRKEFFITTSVALFVVVSALWQIPPIGYFLDLNQMIKDSWIADKQYEPPFGHAELLSLSAFCRKTDIDLSKAVTELRLKNFRLKSPSQTMEELARENGVSPKDIFTVIKKYQRLPKPVALTGQMTSDKIFDLFEGTGIGQKSISEACQIGGKDLPQCMERLRKHNVRAKPGDSVRAVASRSGLAPIQVLQAMLAD